MTRPPLGLRPGLSASVAITTRQANNVTFLPTVAVTPLGGPNSGLATVTVLAPDGTTAQRTIGTGLSLDTTTQVTSVGARRAPGIEHPERGRPGQRPASR